MQEKVIDSFTGVYGFLSNFYNCPVTLDSYIFQNAEAAFQAGKAWNNALYVKFMQTASPSAAKRYGRTFRLSAEQLNEWNASRKLHMYKVLKAKFSNPVLRQKLLETRDAMLVEGNTWNDTFWGVCRGVGENNLGKLLMRIREEYRKEIEK